MADDGLEEQDGGEAAGVDEERGPDGGCEAFVELGVEAGLEGVGGAGGEGEEDEEQGHGRGSWEWLEVLGEEGGDGGEELELGGGGEEVAFAREEFGLVRDVEAGEELVEGVGVRDGDDGVLGAVEDEGGRELGGGAGVPGRDEAAGDVDDGADGEGGVGAEGERHEGAEGDADEGDAGGVDRGIGGDEGDGLAGGFEPERDVDAVGELVGLGAEVAGGFEVVDGEEGEVEVPGEGREALEPEAGVAAGAVEDEEGGELGRAGWDKGFEGDGVAVRGEAGLHGDWDAG